MTKFKILTAPLKIMHQIMMAIARMLDAILRMLFGAGAPSLVSRLSKLSTRSEDVIDAYKDSMSGLSDMAHKMASDVGRSIHMYACAREPLVRAAVDLSGLSIEQQDWLMSLSDDDLERLATAGEVACDRAAQGKRCGIVGLSKPALAQPVHVESGIESVFKHDHSLARHVRAHHVMRKAHGKFQPA